MGIRTTKSSSFIGRRHSLRPHRRQKLSIRRLIAFLIQYAQDQFYYIGAVVERDFKNCVRALRKGSKKLFAFLWRCICAVGRIIYKFSAAIFHDIAAPFKKAARSIKSLGIVLKSAKGRGFAFKMNRVKQFFKYGWLWNKHLVMRFFNYFLPVASLAVCVAVVITVVNLNYSLEVTYNGQQVGYVADSNVFDSACKIIQNRIIVKNDKTWSSDAELRIAVAGSEQLASQDVMANSLLSVSGTEIVEATGLYIGGVFQGATSAPALLQETLDEIIRPYKEQASFDPEIVVKFSRDVELIPGIYPAGSVKSIDDLLNLIRSPDAQDRYYEVSAGESAKEIALKNGLTLEKLQELNPDADMNLTEGTNLLIARAEPLLSIKTVKQLTYTESIAYETTAIKDSRFYVGYLWMVSTGEAGERTLTAEIEYENGEEISRTIISNVVTRPPINQEIIVGSKLQEGQTSVSVGT
ncbi:MAG: G5 domain-containing protein, partial [Oscillospiraceae bacterium]